jgi:hypothetical protein
MSISKINYALAICCAAAIAVLAASPTWAAPPQPDDQQRTSNTYPTYRGATGCVQDLGYGRIVEGCD